MEHKEYTNKNKEIKWCEREKRRYLKDILPLNAPLRIEIAASSICNFKCNYCAHSIITPKPEFFSLELFNKIINSIDKFNSEIYGITFAGLGEPLLNKNIYEMIKKANDYVKDTILITNGSLLTKDNTDKLIDSNIKTVRISLQGINEQDYYNVSKYKINFNQFIENIEYFYKNKSKDTKLYLQIADISIKTDSKKKLLNDIFSNICDNIIVNKIINSFDNVDYTNVLDKNEQNKTSKRLTCSQIFLNMIIHINGDVVPCCSLNDNKPVIGNLNEESLFDIWNGNKLKEMRIKMLEGKKNAIESCKNCILPDFVYNNEYDNIDDLKEELLKRYL